MEQLGDIIVSKNFRQDMKMIYRLASRGIIYANGKLLMIYSSYYHDYAFPGGGNENGEDAIMTLRRECREEAGVNIKNIIPFYKVIEKREIDEHSYTYHESEYFLCEIASITETHLCDYEIMLGYEVRWISILDAIKVDEEKRAELLPSDYDGVLERELRILYKLKELENEGLLK